MFETQEFMPNQFTVPQFIDTEDRILGPVTVRQFVILLVAFLCIAVLWKTLPFIPFVIGAVVLFALAVTFAFARINGMPFHFFVLNMIQTFRKPRLRVWDKALTDQELRIFLEVEEYVPAVAFVHKPLLTTSHLEELSLLVNTGGAYKPEE